VRRSLIASVVVRCVYPILLSLAALLFLKGHNAPGGGFIAGLLVSVAVVLRYMIYGNSTHPRAGSETFVSTVAVGLLIAATTALTPALLGYAFFTHTFGHLHLPLLGDVEFASAALFDLGVAIVVVGNVVTVISAMTEKQ